MKFLTDTHLLIWAKSDPGRLSAIARRHIEDPRNDLYFSVVSLWEIGVKRALDRADFRFDPRVLRSALLADGYKEIPVSAEHVLAVEGLPRIHRDPFDRLLLCQTLVEGLILLTNDDRLSHYPVAVLRV